MIYLDKQRELLRTKQNGDIELVNIIRGYNMVAVKMYDIKLSNKKLKGIYRSLTSFTLLNPEYVYSLLCYYFTMNCLDKGKVGKAYNYILCAKRYLEHASPSHWTALVLECEALLYLYMALVCRYSIQTKTNIYFRKATACYRLAIEHCMGDGESNQFMRLYYLVQLIYVKLRVFPHQVIASYLHPSYGKPEKELISKYLHLSSFSGQEWDCGQRIEFASTMIDLAERECVLLSDGRDDILYLLILPKMYLNIRHVQLYLRHRVCMNSNHAVLDLAKAMHFLNKWVSLQSCLKLARYVASNILAVVNALTEDYVCKIFENACKKEIIVVTGNKINQGLTYLEKLSGGGDVEEARSDSPVYVEYLQDRIRKLLVSNETCKVVEGDSSIPNIKVFEILEGGLDESLLPVYPMRNSFGHCFMIPDLSECK